MRPARFRQADFSLVKIDNAKSMSPAVSSGRSAGSFPEQRLVIEPTIDVTFVRSFSDLLVKYFRCEVVKEPSSFILNELTCFGHTQNYFKIEGNLEITVY